MDQYISRHPRKLGSYGFGNSFAISQNLTDQIFSKVYNSNQLRQQSSQQSSPYESPSGKKWHEMPMWCSVVEDTAKSLPQEGVNRFKDFQIPIYHKLRGYFNDIQMMCMGVFAQPFFESLKKVDRPVTVLDAGVGCGQFFVFYANEHMEVIGVDPLPIYEIISKNAKTLGLDETKIDIVENKLEDMELEDESVDYAVATFVFGAVDDVSKSLDEIHRVLKTGGELYVMDYTLHTTNWWTQFKQIVMDPLYAYQDRYHISRDLIQKLRESKFSVVNIDDKLTRIDLPGGNIKPILFARITK
eukprot:TRINITY_DN3538_c0_g2_i4.p1 TRINITY_DN3538_c0_g2~~TRINITY_DN3538_c0_g2_i4.p1  ORF type:complete len:300 (+),score=30.85 TRINITY_DN3538_c0_g2_i4:82-981(+)